MKKAIYWFRKNLRVTDNPSLKDAIEQNDEVICIYIRDYSTYSPNGLDIGEMGIFRKKFLDESISNLQENLKIFQGSLKGYQMAHSFLVIDHIIAIFQLIIIFH